MQGLANLYRVNYASADSSANEERRAAWSSFTEQLYDMIREEGWTEHRFANTCAWIAKNIPFANLTANDFFRAPMSRLKPYRGGTPGAIDIYKIEGKYFWKERDGQELPFEKVNLKPARTETCDEPPGTGMPPDVRENLERFFGALLSEGRTGATSISDVIGGMK